MTNLDSMASAKPSAKSNKALSLASKKAPRPKKSKWEVQGGGARQRFVLLAETFQALGDTSRVQLVWLLAQAELSVGELVDALAMSQPSVSHHLRTLRNLKLVKVRKDGKTSYYSLDDEHIERLLREGMEHVEDLLK